MPAKVILNPYAGRWKGRERLPEIEKALVDAGVIYEIVTTERYGHGLELARQALMEGFSPIISAGGDGSLSEVVNGMLQATGGKACQVPLGIMPLGTANDFVVNLGLPLDFSRMAQVIASGKTRSVDLGYLDLPELGRGWYFDNNSAIGLEPYITLKQEKISRLRGITRYLVAALQGIADNPQWTVRVEWDAGQYEGPANLVTVGMNPLTGGLFYMTPHANPYDGLLTFVYGYMATRWQILRLLPRTMKPGKGSYVEYPSIHEVTATWLTIHTDKPAPIHGDGVIQSERIQDVAYKVLPAYLPVLQPA